MDEATRRRRGSRAASSASRKLGGASSPSASIASASTRPRHARAPCRRGPSGRAGSSAVDVASCSARRNAPSGRPSAQRVRRSTLASRARGRGSARRRRTATELLVGSPNHAAPGSAAGPAPPARRSTASLPLARPGARSRGAGNGTPSARRRARPCCPSPPPSSSQRSAARSTARDQLGARAPRRPSARRSTQARRLTVMSDLAFAGLARQAQLVRDGEVTRARAGRALACERIERFDPQLNAFGAVYAEQALAAGRRARGPGPLSRRADRGQGRDGHRAARSPAAAPARSPSAAAQDAEVVAAAAGRGRDRDRQDEDARARAVAVHRVDHLGRHPQPVGHRPHAGRLQRRLGGRGRRGPRARPRWRPTGRARSGSPPPAAGCSASSRTRAACRARRTTTTAAHWVCFGGLTRSVADARLMYDVMAPGIDARAAAPAADRLLRALPAAARAASSRPRRAPRCATPRDAAARPRPRGRRARPRPAAPATCR